MTVKPQDRNALPGDKIELQCLVAHIDGVPFNITWTHQNVSKYTYKKISFYQKEI